MYWQRKEGSTSKGEERYWHGAKGGKGRTCKGKEGWHREGERREVLTGRRDGRGGGEKCNVAIGK